MYANRGARRSDKDESKFIAVAVQATRLISFGDNSRGERMNGLRCGRNEDARD